MNPKRVLDRIFASSSDSFLVTGAPGTGKTTLGCLLAASAVERGSLGITGHKCVLFLTFARNAVARIREALGRHLESPSAMSFADDRIRISTFHGFFWWLVDCYNRYTPSGSLQRPWLIGASRLSGIETPLPEGHRGFTFDELVEAALDTLGINAIRRLVSDVYPLVIVDEYQDVDERICSALRLLARDSRMVMLAGPGQAIYPRDPGEVAGVYDFAKDTLRAEELDLEPEGPGLQRFNGSMTDAVSSFENGQMIYVPQDGIRFEGVQNSVNAKPEYRVYWSLVGMWQQMKQLGLPRPSLAILAHTNHAVASIYRHVWIQSEKRGKHGERFIGLSLRDDLLLLYGRLMLALLGGHWAFENAYGDSRCHVTAHLAVLSAHAERQAEVLDDTDPADLEPLANSLWECASAKRPPTGKPIERKALKDLREFNVLLTTGVKSNGGLSRTCFSKRDRPLLDLIAHEFLGSVLPYIRAAASPEDVGMAFESMMLQRVVFEKEGIHKSIQAMTIHKSKGREFDGVILVLESSPTAAWRQSCGYPLDEVEDLYRVGITRARRALTVVAYSDGKEAAAASARRLFPQQ